MPDIEKQFNEGLVDERKQYAGLIKDLQKELEWDGMPYMVTFSSSVPDNVPRVTTPHAACAMWKEAMKGPVYAKPKDLTACAMGADLLFTLPDDQRKRLEEMKRMGERYGWNPKTADRWFERETKLRLERPLEAVIYAPLDQAPCEADVIYMIIEPRQAMLLDYAASFEDGEASPVATAGAACTFIPLCYMRNRTTFGWGDMSLRHFFDLPSEKMFAAIPGRQLRFILRSLRAMKEFYHTIDEIQAMYGMSLDYFAGGKKKKS
jgi:uncharacterized protein (DUF169 family)